MADSENLEKNWKRKMISALGAAAFATAPTMAADPVTGDQTVQTPHSDEHKQSLTIKDFSQPWGKHPMDEFLAPISTLESRGGRDIAHAKVNYGLHEGDTAMGNFALMPKSVKNVAGMLRSDKSLLRQHLGKDFRDPEVSDMHNMSEEEIAKKIKGNMPLQTRVARYLATHLHTLHNGDTSRMAHGWRFGSNRPSHAISDKALDNSGYVKKFKELYKPKTEITAK